MNTTTADNTPPYSYRAVVSAIIIHMQQPGRNIKTKLLL